MLVFVVGSYWVRFAWRSSASGIARVATQLHERGISVQSTLGVYETIFSPAPTAERVFNDPSFRFLLPQTQALWHRLAARNSPGFLASLLQPPRYPEFTRAIARSLHRHGVQILAGTDAMGLPMATPGSSLIHELHLLHQSGLSAYEVIQAATVNPAKFLGRETEFGTIAVGQRADLLLLDRNPLEALSAFEQPLGVMVRGRWLPRERIHELLGTLR